jgi:hypothetical protein
MELGVISRIEPLLNCYVVIPIGKSHRAAFEGRDRLWCSILETTSPLLF